MNPHFRDMLVALCEENVEFLVVGAYAMAVHGFPRFTGDLDIWIRRNDENARRVWRSLERFRAPLRTLAMSDLQEEDVVFQIGNPPARIDPMTSISGVEFDDAWKNRTSFVIEGRHVGVIGRDELLRNKRATGRPKDLIDAAWLESGKP